MVSRFKWLTVIFCLLIVNIAHADTNGAKDYIVNLGTQVVSVLKKDSDINDRVRGLKDVFAEEIDTQWIGKFVLGKYWRQATPEQQEKFLKLYKDYLLLNYVPHFKNYTGETFTVTNVRDDGDGEYLVQTQILRTNGEPPVKVDYRVRQKDSKYQIFDIIAEGISVITTHRSEFGSVIARQGLDAFIDKLEVRVAKVN